MSRIPWRGRLQRLPSGISQFGDDTHPLLQEDPFAGVREVAREYEAESEREQEPRQQPQRRPHPRLARLAVLVSGTGVVIMTGFLAIVIVLLVIVLVTKL